ncbi:unannotated protein [freshwater metagenome]|uniref:Unannotated protein n=1 Tax=freshwater metagenome TaxID=449393 RepID=A0A6J6PWM8_9ZZZZ
MYGREPSLVRFSRCVDSVQLGCGVVVAVISTYT